MRKLLIVDPTLFSMQGHSYNYVLAVQQAASDAFDETVVYADRDFRDPSGLLKTRSVLNRLRLDSLKRAVNSVFHVLGRRSTPSTSAHSTIVPGVWGWLIGLAKWLRARDLQHSLHDILREHAATDELHIFIQHAHLSELQLADRWRERAHLHLVLRYSPDLVNSGQLTSGEFSALLSRLPENVHLYTDSERLTREFRAAGARKVRTLPVPIHLPDHANARSDGVIRIAFLGSSRVEKGYCELPRLIRKLPRQTSGGRIVVMVQVTTDSPDPRIRESTRDLEELGRELSAGALELLQSPVPMDTYYGWLARASIVALPYLSKKYNASTSGIFVEALSFGLPVIVPADSWMADVVEEAASVDKLSIGRIVADIDDIPHAVIEIASALSQYCEAVRNFASRWRRTHNASECVRRLLEAVDDCRSVANVPC
jgi:glycosyltransferase involved in cell wall biosynthesis